MISEKKVLITGADGGIGRAMLEAFATCGYSIFACSRKVTDDFDFFCRNIEEKNKIDIRNMVFDITDHEDGKKKILAAVKNYGCPHVLINNAGILHESLFHMTTIESIKKMFDVNFIGMFYITQIITKLMIRYKINGSIINISSVAATDGIVGQSIYGATKASIETMSKSIAKELGKNDIRVNCIAPGVTDTPFIKVMSKNILDEYRDKTYLGRLGNPADIAAVAVFLASNQSRHITGQVIRVDGGQN